MGRKITSICLYLFGLFQGIASSPSSVTRTSTLSSLSNTASTSVTSIPQMTSTNSKNMTSSNPGHTSAMVTQSLNTDPMGTTTTTKSGGLSTGTTSKTSTLELTSLSSSSENQTSILTEVTTSKHSTSKSGSMLTSSSGDSTTSSDFSVRTSPPTTSQVSTTKPSTDSTSRNTGNTQDTQISAQVTTGILMTSSPQKPLRVTTPISSIQKLSTTSQLLKHNENKETSETFPLTQVTTSTPSLSPSGSTPTQTESQGSSSPDGITNSSTSSVSNMSPITTEVFTPGPSTDSMSRNREHTYSMVSQSSTSVITRVSVTNSPNDPSTVTIPMTSIQALSTSSHNDHTKTNKHQTSPIINVTRTTVSLSPSNQTLAQTVSHGTSTSGETTKPSTSSDSTSSPTSTEVLSTAPSTDSSPGSMTPEVTQSFTTDTELSMTSSPQKPSSVSTPITSIQRLSTSSQNGHTGSSKSQPNVFTDVTASTPLYSPSDQTLVQTVSQGTSSAGETTKPSTSSDRTSSRTTSEVLSPAPSTDSTSGNTHHTFPMVSQSSTSDITRVSVTNSTNVSSTETTPITSPQRLSTSSQNDHTGSRTPQTTLFTEVTISTTSSSPSNQILEQTVSQGTSSSGETTKPSSSSDSTSSPTSPEVLSTAPFMDSNSGNAGHTSPVVSQSLTSIITRGSITNSPNVSSTETTLLTSPQEFSTSSQNDHTGSSSPQTSSLSELNSRNTEHTSSMVSQSSTPVISTVLMTNSTTDSSTVTTAMTSPQGLSTSFQKNHTESNTPQPTHLPEGVSTSSQNDHTGSSSPQTSSLTETGSQGASSPDEITNPSTSSVSNMSPTTLEVFTAAPSTNSTSVNTGHTSSMIFQNSTSVITGVSMSNSPNVPTGETTLSTSPQELSTSLNKHTESMETSSTPQTTLTNVTTSRLSPSSSGPTQTLTVSLGTSSSGEITIPSASSISNSPPATSDILTTTDSASGNTGHTPAHVTGSLSAVTSRASSTTLSGQSTILLLSTSTQPSSTFSQSYQTTSMATSSVSSTSLLTEVTTENHSSSSPGPTVTNTLSHGTSFSGMTTNSPKTDSDRGTSLSATSVTLTSTTTASRATLSPFPILPEQGISLFPYGTNSQVGDRRVFARTVDFTSSLFKLQIGFPLGSSLRDSFYFTDNGQIIFPESDYNIFSYPNPPQRGFTGREPVAMVAPFWADADFSSRGTIFYQAYDTLYGENHWLIRKVETLIHKFTSDWSYKAKWTLKVTWVDVPAYPAQWSFGTSTYQAILSTDGSRSYALFLYQNGGMRWDVTQGLRNQVLMGFSSGDGYFENSPLTFRPAMEKYRPDRFLNSKLGIRGVQIYRLHREVMPNYRVKCLQWLNSQPQRPSWSWGLNQVSCPCSWQQGLLDLRFWRVNTGSWGSSSWHLCTFSSWQGGMCCSYGRWGEFREGWRMHSPWQFEQEREAQQWCCHWNDKPAFCAQYYHMRPRVNCAWYRPPRPAWTYGDPHITTLDNVNYTFNGLGDFLLVQAQDTSSSFLLEGRTAQTGSARATNFIAFAAQYSTSNLGPPITVQWFLEPNDTIRVLHNNQTVTFNTSNTNEGLPMFNTTGVLLTQNGSQVSANFDGTVTISVIALSNILHASSSLPEYYHNHTTGLLGVWNDNPHDDFRMPNGSTIPQNSSEEAIFHYGMTWQVNGTGLLGMRTDSPPSNFTPIFLSELLSTENESLTSGCSGDVQCKFDALATRKANIGQNTSTILKTFRRVNVTLNRYPPSIDCSRDIQAYRGQTKTFVITSNSKDITLNLVNECSGFKLLENGSLQWTPTSPEACTLEILARDTRTNLSSILQPRTVACFCSRENQCLYNETSREGNSSLEVTSCQCDGNTFGRFCERSRDHCEEPCFPNVSCIPGKGCEACPPNMTGDGRHCAALEDSLVCQTHSCPANYCYNHGHCYISEAPDCQPTCTCPPAFTDSRCLLAGNSFTPTISKDLPLRTIMLSLRENENASQADVNASVAYILGTLDVRAFLWNSLVDLTRTSPSAQPSDKSVQHWRVISHFQYRPRGPVIHFLNNQLIDAVVEAFLLQASRRQKRNVEEARKNVTFFPISRADVQDMIALNLSTLNNYFLCEGYRNYSLVYSPQNGVTCVSPCSEGYCHNEGQCQHLPDGPQCSCTSFTIYTSWGERCEHLSVKLGAFFGILFGALGALLLLGILAFAIFQLCGRSTNKFSYSLNSEL
ncbi:mucin-4 [Sigmodon hispidus]